MRLATYITTIAAYIIFSGFAGSAESDEPQANKSSVYAKVILLSDHPYWNQVGLREPADDELPKVGGVESWIAEQVSDDRRLKLKAATNWILLPENVESGKLIFRGCECPASGRVTERTSDGKIHIELAGWAPSAPTVDGDVIPADIGTRHVATVRVDENPEAYVALLVVPKQ